VPLRTQATAGLSCHHRLSRRAGPLSLGVRPVDRAAIVGVV
jgi:hypothetical protein